MKLPLKPLLIACVLSLSNAVCSSGEVVSTAPPAISSILDPAQASPLRSYFMAPQRILWKSETGVKNAENLLLPKPGQALLSESVPPCSLASSTNQVAGILLDFGAELQGYVELFTPLTSSKDPVKVRVRFGESASEAMAELGGKKNAQNDHAVRDSVHTLPWLGKLTVGPSGFRFVRIDAVDPERPVTLTQVRAVLQIRDLPYRGAFRCNDERLNQIWRVGAYTVQLNMQDYLWDGIKRDRLVWIGDMHPEVSTINAVFGFQDVVPRSLDLVRDATPVTQWMNGISSYSMWWVLIHEELWNHYGDKKYLEAQKAYLTPLLLRLASMVDEQGSEKLDGTRFLDWPTSENKPAIHAGLQALLIMSLESGSRLVNILGDEKTARICLDSVHRLRGHRPQDNGSKQAAALMSLAGLCDAKEAANQVLKNDGPRGLSTFYGYYVLQALAGAGEYDTALDFINGYWGAMLDYGATTFWEDFNLAWTNNATRIDELAPPGKKDIHGDYGAYCYEGYRHSLSHGWASGPTAWLSQHVLGIKPASPGCRQVQVIPHLGHLQWAEGSYPTPYGPIKVRHERRADGQVVSEIQAPREVKVVRQ